ncbi:hypothetical protein [Saccharothrix deserti]|uniref:hypothetical protein n=1 Tax=Saccharothrix deserti TaxID=2593674 RepID=UPI00131E5B36|nr:hypothetical protein [Saccharothrix deserti]
MAARLLRPASQETYEKVFGMVYVGLMANVLLAVSCAPLLLALAVVRDPLASWPFFVVLSGFCAPALAGVFGCFAALGSGAASEVWRPFRDAYRRAFGRALAVWFGGAAVLVVLGFDAVIVARTAWGPALAPFFVTAAVLVVSTVVAVIVVLATAETPVRLRDVVWPCLCLVARRWYLAAANAVVLGLAVAVVSVQPVVGLFVACAPLLYVVFGNTRATVAPLSER